jgi:hypothetical protein
VYYGNGAGLRVTPRQYQTNLSTALAEGGLCTTPSEAGIGLYAKSSDGRQKGLLVWEYQMNGVPYDGNPVTVSVTSTGEQSGLTNLGAAGVELKQQLTGLTAARVFKWRARVKYDPVTSLTGQVYGPWRYMPGAYRREAGFRTSSSAAPLAPELLAPAYGAVDVSVTPELDWYGSATATVYEVQVSTGAGFPDTIWGVSGVTDTFATAGGLDDNTRYYWRARAENAFGAGRWCSPWYFTTALDLPAAVTLVSPPDGDTATADSVVLVWNAGDPTVSKYWVEYATDSSMAGAVMDSNVADTSFVARGLSDNTVYWWRVRARNATGWGPYSAKRGVEIQIPTGVRLPRSVELRPSGLMGRGGVLHYGLPSDAFVRIRLFSLLGEQVAVAVNERQAAGYHSCSLGAGGPAPGRYLLVFEAGPVTIRRRVTIVR